LKRNNVAIDIINFANPDNVEKLKALVNAANNSDNSHFMDVPMGINMITDVLITSPILMNEDFGGAPNQNAGGMGGDVASGGGAAAANPFANYGGIDPNIEPELAEAMRISLEEERHRHKEEDNKKEEEVKAPAEQPPSAEVADKPAEKDVAMNPEPEEDDDEELDEEEMLKRAL